MDVETLIARMEKRLALAPRLGYRIKFDLKGEGLILLDGTESPAAIAPVSDSEDSEVDTTLTLSPDNLARLVDGQLDPTVAYMTGKMKIDGSMGVALKLASLLED